MTELDQLIETALQNGASQEATNKFYVALFRTVLYMPAYLQEDEDEPFSPLYLQDNDNYFIPVFDTVECLRAWLTEENNEMEYVEIQGSDIIRCIGEEQVYLCLNPGSDYYKEFSPEELQKLKMMIAKIDTLKTSASNTSV